MKQCDISSKLVITLKKDGSSSAEQLETWTWTEVYGGVPEAMWGPPVAGETAPPPDAKTLPNRLLGIQNLIPPKAQATGPEQFPVSRVSHEPVLNPDGSRLPALLPLRSDAPSIVKTLTIRPDGINDIRNTIASAGAKEKRVALAPLLAGLGIDTNDDMSKTSANAGTLFVASPFGGAPWESAA